MRKIPLFVWMLVIFCLSQQSGEDFKNPVDWWKDLLISLNISIPFDKVAHFGIYGVLGLTAYIAWPKSPIKAFLICVLYGMSDEIHQIFVPGRSCDGWDLLADATGGLVALILATLVGPFLTQRFKVDSKAKPS